MKHYQIYRPLFFGVLFALSVSYAIAQTLSPIIQKGHQDRITAVVMADSGNTIISSGIDNSLLVWDRSTQLLNQTLLGYTGGISVVDYNRKGSVLVIGTYDKKAIITRYSDTASDPVYLEFGYYVTGVRISNEGNYVAVSSADGSLVINTPDTSIKMRFEDEVVGLAFSPDNQSLYVGNYSGNVHRIDLTHPSFRSEVFYTIDGNVSELCISETGKTLAIGGTFGTVGKVIVVKISNTKELNQIDDYAHTLGFKYNSLHFNSDKELFYLNYENGVSRWNIKKNYAFTFTNDELSSGFDINNGYLVYGVENTITLRELNKPLSKIEFVGEAENPIRIIGLEGNNVLLEYPSGIKMWNVKDLSLEYIRQKIDARKWKYASVTKDLKYIDDGSKLTRLKDKYWSVRDVGWYMRRDIKLSAFSATDSFYARLDDYGHFTVANLHDLKKSRYLKDDDTLYWKYRSTYSAGYIDKLVVHPIENKMVLLTDGFDFFDLDKGVRKRMTSYIRKSKIILPGVFDPVQDYFLLAESLERYDSVSYEAKGYSGWTSTKIQLSESTSSNYLNKKKGHVRIYDLDSLKYQLYLSPKDYIQSGADVSALHFDVVNSILFIGYSDGTVRSLRSTDSGYYNIDYTRFTSGVKDLKTSDDGKYLYVLNDYGSLGMLEADGFLYLASLVTNKENEFIVFDVEGNYKRSKNAQNLLAYTRYTQTDENLFKLNQVDYQFNRPAKVLRKIGLEEEHKIGIIEGLTKKKTKDSSAIYAPDLEIVNKGELPSITTKGEVSLSLKAVEKKAELSHLKIWLNGVPYFEPGKETKVSGKVWKESISLPLKQYDNTLRLVVVDKNGVESMPRIVQINCKKPYKKPNLYIAVISVDKYEDESRNLQYAVKDGSDFAHVFLDENNKKRIGFPSRFGKIFMDTLYNHQATRENILELRSNFNSSKPDDYVLIYVSGHGLLDSENKFWYGTHDVDFDAPEVRGLSFEELEGLVVGIPAQQKLLLMDACHSGEVLEDEETKEDDFELPEGTKATIRMTGTRGAAVELVSGEEVERSELKMQLFSNYNSLSGATVISAAAGNSFALESEEWNNGIFTYTIIRGLINRFADANKDGEVSVVELSRYVNTKVKEHTDGMQIPNDRQENIENNFRIW